MQPPRWVEHLARATSNSNLTMPPNAWSCPAPGSTELAPAPDDLCGSTAAGRRAPTALAPGVGPPRATRTRALVDAWDVRRCPHRVPGTAARPHRDPEHRSPDHSGERR